MDASFKAVMKITEKAINLLVYTLHSVTEGQDAVGKVAVKIEVDLVIYNGRGTSTDIEETSIKALLDALSKSLGNEKGCEKEVV